MHVRSQPVPGGSQRVRRLLGVPRLNPLLTSWTGADFNVELRDRRSHRRQVGLRLRVRRDLQGRAAVGTVPRDRHFDRAVHLGGFRTPLMRAVVGPRFAARFLRLRDALVPRKPHRLPMGRPLRLLELLAQLLDLRGLLLAESLQLRHARFQLAATPTRLVCVPRTGRLVGWTIHGGPTLLTQPPCAKANSEAVIKYTCSRLSGNSQTW